MLVYRIVHKKYSNSLQSSGLEGRWNGRGKKVIYTGGTVEIAFLESMIRRQGAGFNDNFRTMIIEIPDEVKVSHIRVSSLPPGWRDFRDYSKCQQLGNDWYDKSETAVLKVPSAVLPGTFNYILNSVHPAFRKIRILASVNLVPDPRIEEILKKYRK